MALRVAVGVAALVLSAAPARADDFNPEADFLNRASIGNLFAIAEARLALERSGDPAVKTFAQRLVGDHQGEETALQAAAVGAGAAVPAALDADHQARVTALQGKSGAAFDKAYIADQVEDHSNALTLYADYMLLGDNAKLNALAVKLIPVTEAQLKVAQALSGR